MQEKKEVKKVDPVEEELKKYSILTFQPWDPDTEYATAWHAPYGRRFDVWLCIKIGSSQLGGRQLLIGECSLG